jgi:hypothetical protein
MIRSGTAGSEKESREDIGILFYYFLKNQNKKNYLRIEQQFCLQFNPSLKLYFSQLWEKLQNNRAFMSFGAEDEL